MRRGRPAVILLLAIVSAVMSACSGGSEEARLRAAREKKRAEEENRREEAVRLREEAIQALDLVLVPGGSFSVGDDSFGGIPETIVEVDDFLIGRFEVSNDEFARYVEATEAVPPYDWVKGSCPEDRRRHPVIVPYMDAVAYAEWVGCRLPTKFEWERAARGDDGRNYPWGNEFDPSRCNSDQDPEIGDTVPVDSFPEGVSPYGCYNMAGNVKEWTTDDSRDGKKKILKGGAFYDRPRWVMCAFESEARPGVEKNPGIGFRLAKDPE
jgi:formylglycine-generating enzyme required for sulfatase activity